MIKQFIKTRIVLPIFERFQYLLNESSDYTKRRNDERYIKNQIRKGVHLSEETTFEGDCQIEKDSIFMGSVNIKSYTLIGHNNILWGGNISIGRYCQVAPFVSIYSKNHSLNSITTYNNRRLFDSRLKDLDEYEPVKIGNDVWIGVGATILPGVTVGSGVIIGAGAVVTRNLPNYVVAAGNPARIIKNRFSPELTDLLLRWGWWDLTPTELLPYEDIFFMNISEKKGELVQRITELLGEKE